MLCSCNHYYELYEPPPVLVVSSPQLMLVWAKVTPQQHQQHQQHSKAHNYTGPGISSPGSPAQPGVSQSEARIPGNWPIRDRNQESSFMNTQY